MPRTNKEIRFEYGMGQVAIIPKGTACVVADNLPQPNDSEIEYWVCQWAGMSDEEESRQRTYGFGLSAKDVDA